FPPSSQIYGLKRSSRSNRSSGRNVLNALSGRSRFERLELVERLNGYFPFRIFQTFSLESCLPVTIHFQSVSSKYFTPALGRLPGLRYDSSISVRKVAEP